MSNVVNKIYIRKDFYGLFCPYSENIILVSKNKLNFFSGTFLPFIEHLFSEGLQGFGTNLLVAKIGVINLSINTLIVTLSETLSINNETALSISTQYSTVSTK